MRVSIQTVAFITIGAAFVLWVAAKLAIPHVVEGSSEYPFRNYYEIKKGVEKTTSIMLYEGLPHPTWENELYEEERIRDDVFEQDGHLFYKRPLRLTTADATRLKELFLNEAHFEPYMGLKLCGGYHPDYSIEWQTREGIYRTQICFGCYEMKSFGPESDLYCDLTDAGHERFEAVLKKYRQERPEKEMPLQEAPPPAPDAEGV